MAHLTKEDIEFLLSERAKLALDDLSNTDLSETATLTRLTELRRRYSPSEASVLLEQARLRQRAITKFPASKILFFTDEALQQASSHVIAEFRAQRFAVYRSVADLGSGIGGDTMALARIVPLVVAVEQDVARAQLLAANVAAQGLSDHVRVICADWTRVSLEVEAAFVDPSRRVDGKRVFRLDQMTPPLSAIRELMRQVPNVALKTTPGINYAEIPGDAEIEFISEKGITKESLLLFGELRRGVARTATLLPGPHRLNSTDPVAEIPISAPKRFFYEPDGAVIRATLVATLATEICAAQVDSTIAYLTSDELVLTPFARAWQVIRHDSFHLKTLNHWLRDLKPGEVIVKKRGSPIDPDEFRRRLKTVPSGPTVTVFLTRVRGRPWMIVASEVIPSE